MTSWIEKQEVSLKCQCCGVIAQMDFETAFEEGWDAPPYFAVVTCPDCPASLLLIGSPDLEKHQQKHTHQWSKSMNKFSPKIEWRDPKTLTPYVKNTKQHPTDQIDKIASSIAEYGFDQPICIDEDGVIIKGHGRREAALRLNLKEVPVVVRTDLTDLQKKAARIADNRVAESGWDEETLKLELTDLRELGLNMELTGFDQKELDKLLTDVVEPEEGLSVGEKFEYKVIVDVSDEHAQQELVERLEAEGYECRVLIS